MVKHFLRRPPTIVILAHRGSAALLRLAMRQGKKEPRVRSQYVMHNEAKLSHSTASLLGRIFRAPCSRAICPSPRLHSFILRFFCVMSTANIEYPPAAHLYHAESARKPVITSVQPRAGATMTVGPDNNNSAQMRKAERLRGGCVPCPDGSVCWIIPIPCCCC
ncbi:hypothetical protein BC826DRAFT_988640 [Russula brevipes]|nr:hypothetical protein BC826DRAFT_988640 [Russula brevipes]